jgi:phage terminase large subunit-like protein
LDVTLHARQLEIFEDDHRFKIVAAGRRFGKSFLAAVLLLAEASKTTKVRSDGVEVNLTLEEVFYVGPTFDQSKRIMWPVLMELGRDLIAFKHEQTGTLTLINGRRISIKGSDRPDNLRGTGLSYVVMDEYAFMREEVWELIIQPQLARSEGGALFIGTPDGKNHFFELYKLGMSPEERYSEYKSFHFPSVENPYLPAAEIERARNSYSIDRFRQEFEADFESGGGAVMTGDMFPIVPKINVTGHRYIAIDLAGFEKVEGGKTMARRDEHAIAVVIAHQGGWLVERIIHGQWDTRETALRIVKAYRDYKPMKIGIEKGMAKNAVMPYLEDEMNRFNTWFTVDDLSHGNQRKTDRIAWALQGRAEKGRIQLLTDEHLVNVNDKWVRQLLEQVTDFPSQLSHDDLLDALSYIDQLADPWFDAPAALDYWDPMDREAGY